MAKREVKRLREGSDGLGAARGTPGLAISLAAVSPDYRADLVRDVRGSRQCTADRGDKTWRILDIVN